MHFTAWCLTHLRMALLSILLVGTASLSIDVVRKAEMSCTQNCLLDHHPTLHMSQARMKDRAEDFSSPTASRNNYVRLDSTDLGSNLRRL